MGLFGFGKKKEELNETSTVKVLGSGCAKVMNWKKMLRLH